ncbi:hypothetical protein [Iningainema tapete]|uniref:DUF2281 domain-containing protein n=1 Tax=Iningainema tapete BLCC-T55 TaxID=2748662 RepID=A0A8J7C0H8_9CYAN|nr:hypothetical protein [Iningainema tapete]MBD2778053.1 hypothetical protein [Iningainema tapete BLCC-T55]
MTVHNQTIAKIYLLPEPLIDEVNDFIDFLLWKHKDNITESLEMVDSDFSNYLTNLEDYENRLDRGEIKW